LDLQALAPHHSASIFTFSQIGKSTQVTPRSFVMFRELSPLLTRRSLVLTVSSIGEDRIRLTITPRPTDKAESKEVIQPLAVEGTAEELDTDLAKALVDYTAEHLTLARSLEHVKANMEAALKEVKEQAAKKVADAKNASKPSSTKTAVAPAPEVKKPAPPSLFDSPKEPPTSPRQRKIRMETTKRTRIQIILQPPRRTRSLRSPACSTSKARKTRS
jgi:PRTRC genetic system protein E